MSVDIGEFGPYDEYQTPPEDWMGGIPSEWGVKRARYCFEEIDERSKTGEEELLSLSKTEGLVPRSQITDEEHRADSLEGYKICQKGDIVMNKMQAWNGMFGIASQEGLVSPDYTVFRPESDVLPEYYQYLLKTPLYVGQFRCRSRGIGTAYLRLHTNYFYEIPLHHPTSEVQSKISEFLDYHVSRIESLIERKRSLISLLEEKRDSLIAQIVTQGLESDRGFKESGIEWVGEIPEEWDVTKLSWLLSRSPQNGISPPITSDQEGTPTFSISVVRNGDISVTDDIKYADISEEKASNYQIREGDVLMVRGNGNREMVGKCGVVQPPIPEGCIYPDILIRLQFRKDMFEKYFVYLLNSNHIRPQIETGARTSTGVWKISQETLSNIVLPCPPLDEQKNIVKSIEDLDNRQQEIINKTHSSIELLEEKKESLITKVATGKIDITDWQVKDVQEAKI
jgi:type I restriction enzyme S subunit